MLIENHGIGSHDFTLLISHENGFQRTISLDSFKFSIPKLRELENDRSILLTVFKQNLVLIKLTPNGSIHSFFKKTTPNTVAYLNSITSDFDKQNPIKSVEIIF